ncbi:putative aminopeptidase W07G4.4 [Rhopilema esculentum]|uniref:putative aminopeptidase W07G4.4 n=1 Tax=Rhopilema esculentum TaxID=499914 RepID=UPI0031E2A5A1
MGLLDFDVAAVTDSNLGDGAWDCVVLVCENLDWPNFKNSFAHIKPAIEDANKIDQGVKNGSSVFYFKEQGINLVIFSQAGPLNREFEDSRKYLDVTLNAMKRALKAGCRKPLLVLPGEFTFNDYATVCLLAALEACYVPLEIRQDVPKRAKKVDALGLYVGKGDSSSDYKIQTSIIEKVVALESGRIVARDIGGSDPERMAARKVAEYLQEIFKDSTIKISVEDDVGELNKKYPLLGAVNRAASRVDRHQGRVITLEYVGEGEIKSTYMFVGKGITYDTGGADVKAGGHMAGMHRDKCGAATVAGFFKTVDALKPSGIKVVGRLAMVRNSVGADSYVADEIITSAAGVRVRVGNTDAEGRMAMADPLHYTAMQALGEINPHLMTIATLTGHAIRAVGPEYTIVLDNGPAREKKFAQRLQEEGEKLADPFEISTIRREDYKMIAGPSEYEDVLQCNNEPSSMTSRGHQFPAAFLIRTSGLDKHGVGCEKPLCYSHLDIAGSSGPFPGIPTGRPIVALAKIIGLF